MGPFEMFLIGFVASFLGVIVTLYLYKRQTKEIKKLKKSLQSLQRTIRKLKKELQKAL